MESENNTDKPRLSDIAKQNNAAKSALFTKNMIPAPPMGKPAPAQPVVDTAQAAPAELATAVVETPAADPVPTPAKATIPVATGKPQKGRKSGALTIDDLLGPVPEGETYPRQVRISDSHHYLLREVALRKRTNINRLVYNLLDLLEEADQRDKQKGTEHA